MTTETFELTLGRDPVKVAPLTGQRKIAAASLPYVKLVLIGSTGEIAPGQWLLQLCVTSDVEGTLRVMNRRNHVPLIVHFEAWTDVPIDVAQVLKARFDTAAGDAGRRLKDGTSLFDLAPEKGLEAVRLLAAEIGVSLYGNAWYEAQVTARAERNARVVGGRR